MRTAKMRETAMQDLGLNCLDYALMGKYFPHFDVCRGIPQVQSSDITPPLHPPPALPLLVWRACP
jgi:hypothetical protein